MNEALLARSTVAKVQVGEAAPCARQPVRTSQRCVRTPCSSRPAFGWIAQDVGAFGGNGRVFTQEDGAAAQLDACSDRIDRGARNSLLTP